MKSRRKPGSTIVLRFIAFLSVLSYPTTVSSVSNYPPNFATGGDLTRFSIREDTPVGTVIYRLKGSDPENGELTFSISGEYFRVNRKSGDLTLIKALDRENEASIDVIISLTDDGHGGEPATISLRREILVSDVNDNPPMFENTPYNFKVSEKTQVGTTIFSAIGITDEDFGSNAEIGLTCETTKSPEACEYFGVSAEPIAEGNYIGLITLMMPLDYEKHTSFALTLQATDGHNSVSALVAISVLDVQDQSPRFIGGPYVFKVKENSPPGTTVGNIYVQDGDTGNPRDMQIKLTDDAQNNYFRLSNIKRDAFNGTITATVETADDILDAEEEFIRENLGVYELTMEAREFPLNADDTEPTLVTRVGLAVMIEDIDDNLPTFEPQQYPYILEIPYRPDESWSFPDLKLQVEDVDENQAHAQFHLQLDWTLPTAVDSVFAFITPAPTNPVVRSKTMVTLEVLNISLLEPGSKFDLEIGAYQRDHLVSKINLPIEVASGVKPVPMFNATVFRITVPEDIANQELITKISLQNGHLLSANYSLVGLGAEKFNLDHSTGEIRCGIDNCVDYERERSHFFVIKAKSGDKVEDETYAFFHLDTLPKNDEPPKFPQSGSIRRSVPDGTVTFDPPFVVAATDQDLSDQLEYGVVDHSINSSGIYINADTGELKLKKKLSWAENGEHKLTVTATDKSGKSAFQSVLLIVQPVSNMPPNFPYAVQEVVVAETLAPLSPIFRVSAHDPDGQDAALRFFLHTQPEIDLFDIEEISGMIRLSASGKLDYEAKPRMYSVTVRVQDEGKPSETATALVKVTIQDVNDESPKFSRPNYVAEVSESSKLGYEVTKVLATDGDALAILEYSISCPCKSWDASGSMGSDEDAEKYASYLRMDPKFGNISLTTSFEHKLTSVLEFQVNVQDRNGFTAQNDTAMVTLYITAAERLFPYFGEPWTPTNPWINLTVPEDMSIGSNVATLNAWDYIADEEITNFVLVDEDAGPFGLEDNILRVTALLDYETKKDYVISIKAQDARGGESVANLAIKLTDTNDHDPVFSKPEYRGKIAENSVFPTPILTVEASDRDDPENYGAIRYTLIGPQSQLFNIDELAGVVQVAPGADIDRETDSAHTIFVLALDTPLGGPFQRTAMATLKIQVTDVNDNDPVCRQTEEFLVDEAARPGTLIGNVTCTDPDESPSLVYSLRDDTNLGLFAINPKTGTLSVAKSMRGRGRSVPYGVTVVVEDGKDRIVSVSVEIKLANTIPNDGLPQFAKEGLQGEVSEGSFPGSPVIHIQASDTDSLENGEGRLVYRIMKQIYPCLGKDDQSELSRVEDVNYFRIDENTGMLTLQHAVDREKHDCLSVLVGVNDLGVPPRTNSEWFTITVLDVDDSLPNLPKSIRSVQMILNETTSKDTEIFQFDASDADIYPNNRVSFELIVGSGSSGTEFFKLVQLTNQSAALIVTSDLDKLELDEVTMIVKCYPKERKMPLPDCSSKVNVKIRRSEGRTGGKKSIEMILGVSSGVPVGNLIGNAEMMPTMKIDMSPQMYHPNVISQSPYNVSELVRIDPGTGDIYVWDNLEPFQNGHVRVELQNPSSEAAMDPPLMTKKVKIFIAPNSQLLSTETSEFLRMTRWTEDIQQALNQPKSNTQINNGVFRLLTFDQSNAPEGRTMVCFQLLENENMMSQEKSLQMLNVPDVQDIFLKHAFPDQIQKGCPKRPQGPAKMTLAGAGGQFWVERSLVGIASVVAIATLSFITILCLVNRNKTEKR